MPFLYKRLDYELKFIPVLGSESLAVSYEVPYEAPLSYWEPILTDKEKKVIDRDIEYTFAGWYYDEDYTKPVDWANDRMPAEGFSVYAKWVCDSVNITFDWNYDGAPEAVTYTMAPWSFMEDQEGFEPVPSTFAWYNNGNCLNWSFVQ